MTVSKSIADRMDVSLGTAAPALRDIIHLAIEARLDDRAEGPRIHEVRDLAFSRAEGSDYLALVRMWRDNMAGRIAGLPERGCPACAGEKRHNLFESYDCYPYVACLDCGTWYVPHQVTGEIIAEFHRRVPEAGRIADRMMSGRNETTRTIDRSRFARYFDLLTPLLARIERPRYLDIGCGVGHSVEFASELGMAATGVEISQVAVDTARANGRNVVLPEDHDPDAVYDLVALFETLEHVTDPDDMLHKARQSLAPGGAIVITVPNRASWEVSLLRERCFHVYGGTDGVGHINLFATGGLDRLLARHDLSLVHTDCEHGSDVMQIFSHLSSDDRSALDVIDNGRIDLDLPYSVRALLNATGPALSLLERVLVRSPILVAVGCRKEDVVDLAPEISMMKSRLKRELLDALSSI